MSTTNMLIKCLKRQNKDVLKCHPPAYDLQYSHVVLDFLYYPNVVLCGFDSKDIFLSKIGTNIPDLWGSLKFNDVC